MRGPEMNRVAAKVAAQIEKSENHKAEKMSPEQVEQRNKARVLDRVKRMSNRVLVGQVQALIAKGPKADEWYGNVLIAEVKERKLEAEVQGLMASAPVAPEAPVEDPPVDSSAGQLDAPLVPVADESEAVLAPVESEVPVEAPVEPEVAPVAAPAEAPKASKSSKKK